jgi:hypothetical protein
MEEVNCILLPLISQSVIFNFYFIYYGSEQASFHIPLQGLLLCSWNLAAATCFHLPSVEGSSLEGLIQFPLKCAEGKLKILTSSLTRYSLKKHSWTLMYSRRLIAKMLLLWASSGQKCFYSQDGGNRLLTSTVKISNLMFLSLYGPSSFGALYVFIINGSTALRWVLASSSIS